MNDLTSHLHTTPPPWQKQHSMRARNMFRKYIIKDKCNDRTDKRKLNQPNRRLAILRPFCAFDAEALPTTFAAWESLPPCKAAVSDLGDIDDDLDGYNGTSSKEESKDVAADLFLFYSQSYYDSPEAVTAVDSIIKTFNEPGGWSECFENIYAIEANILPELDLYLPSAQEDLYNWLNGPNRQYEAGFRVIQSGEWGQYDGFYLMEGDSIPVKAHWLDVLLEEIEKFRPFAILGAWVKYLYLYCCLIQNLLLSFV